MGETDEGSSEDCKRQRDEWEGRVKRREEEWERLRGEREIVTRQEKCDRDRGKGK